MSDIGQELAEDEWTCGRGLAHHSAVPAKMADYLAALTRTLRTHLRTIDRSTAPGQDEWDAYRKLADAYADLADGLGTAAARMRGYRDLPAAPHYEKELADPVLTEAFATFVKIETELAALLRASAEQDQEMLRNLEEPESQGGR
jgi:hypothetical protein